MVTLCSLLKRPFGFCRLGPGSDSEAEDIEHAEKLRQVKAVLEEVCVRIFILTEILYLFI